MNPSRELPLQDASVTQSLLREFSEQNLSGLNISRVKQFVKARGFQPKPTLIVTQEDLKEIKKIVGSSSMFDWLLDEQLHGRYIHELDLPVVVRNPKLERLNGTIFTESIFVHELAHANHSFFAQKNGVPARIGFALPYNQTPWGWFLEEGYPEMLSASYKKKYAPKSFLEQLSTVAKTRIRHFEHSLMTSAPGLPDFSYPAKFAYVSEKMELDTSKSVCAGAGVELLCKVNPSLPEIIRQARHSTRGLTALAKAIEDIKPGLYRQIQRCDYSPESFARIYVLIINSIPHKDNYFSSDGHWKYDAPQRTGSEVTEAFGRLVSHVATSLTSRKRQS